jgi:hypothetical protein
MDHIEGGSDESKSFFSYMFSLNSNEKNDLINMLQYSVLAIIPIIIVLKLMKKYIPSEDDKKASIEILIELVLQLIIIFASFWFIHKLIAFIPTYTKAAYPHFSIIQLIIPITFILFSMNSSISEKATILLNRILVAVGIVKENYDEEEQVRPKNVASVPPSLIPMLPNPETSTRGGMGVPTYDQRQDPTFAPNGFGQAQCQQYGIQEPAPANEMLGGSAW